jgi:hypothetical protein
VPRGGGGGSHGGGFHGGGIRGSGGVTFRSSTSFTTPFGRTGAQRVTNHGPSGPFIHTTGMHPPGHFYPHRWHWWGGYGWGGYGYGYGGYRRSGGCVGCCVCAVFLVLFASIFAFSGMFGDFTSGSEVKYMSMETLYYNEYWYEYESVSAGSQITFIINSIPAKVTFIISDKYFSSLPTTTANRSIQDQIHISPMYYEYWMLYLNAGSSFTYNFNSSNPVDFLILDGANINKWYQGDPHTSYQAVSNVITGGSTFSIPTTQDYYLIWENSNTMATIVNYSISYVAVNVFDYSDCLFHQEAVNSIAMTTVEVPRAGNWYFYVYFDPMNAQEESTTVTFDVTYKPSSTAGVNLDSDSNLYYIVPVIVIVVIFLIIIVFAVSRSRAKSRPQTEVPVTPAVETPFVSPKPIVTQAPVGKVTRTSQPETTLNRCYSCGVEMHPGASFCNKCGRKQQGRQETIPDRITPAQAKNCSLCGSTLEPDTKYCAYCGTPVE